MIISQLTLKNWRNFLNATIPMRNRVFIVGANASGKSNILDAIRFLRDVARSGGGLQEAVRLRGGMSKIRCLAATGGDVEFAIHFAEHETAPLLWRYELGITSYNYGGKTGTVPRISYERVWNSAGKQVLSRPDDFDHRDEKLLEYTALEQPRSNAAFREIATILNETQYLHLIPQLLRDPNSYTHDSHKEDYYGRDFLERLSKTPTRTRDSYLRRIQNALQSAVPQFEHLAYTTDDIGKPHLKASYRHWRKHPAKQLEDQFSDGTLRLIGLLWMLQDGKSAPLLLEEPELSLHAGVVSKIAEMIAQIQAERGNRQVILTTHSAEILANSGIALEEIVLLRPNDTHTEVISPPLNPKEAKALLGHGQTLGEVVMHRTRPPNIHQLSLWSDKGGADSPAVPKKLPSKPAKKTAKKSSNHKI
jgi:predicted ATPase